MLALRAQAEVLRQQAIAKQQELDRLTNAFEQTSRWGTRRREAGAGSSCCCGSACGVGVAVLHVAGTHTQTTAASEQWDVHNSLPPVIFCHVGPYRRQLRHAEERLRSEAWVEQTQMWARRQQEVAALRTQVRALAFPKARKTPAARLMPACACAARTAALPTEPPPLPRSLSVGQSGLPGPADGLCTPICVRHMPHTCASAWPTCCRRRHRGGPPHPLPPAAGG